MAAKHKIYKAFWNIVTMCQYIG